MKHKTLFMFFILVLFVEGCGTVMHGSIQKISVTSIPNDAVATFYDLERDRISIIKVNTPATVNLSRRMGYSVTIEKEGYESRDALINKEVSGLVWGNLLFLPGFIIDVASGGAWTLEPDVVNVTLPEKKLGQQKTDKTTNGPSLILQPDI